MPPTRRQRDESTATTRSVRPRTTTQQQTVQIEEPRPLELPPAEPVRQDATLEEMLQYPELIFNSLNPIARGYVHRVRWQIDNTQYIIQKIRNVVREHPEKEQEITNILRSYIQKIREVVLLDRKLKHAERESDRIRNATRITRDGRDRADPSCRARGLRNRARDLYEQERDLF